MTTKLRPANGFIVLAVVVGLLLLVFGRVPGTDVRHDTDEYVSLLVEFQPTPREEPVHITVTVDGHQTINAMARTSPWRPDTGGFWIPKGAEVMLNAQQTRDGKLSCAILGTGGKIMTLNQRPEMGSVRCWHNRKAVK